MELMILKWIEALIPHLPGHTPGLTREEFPGILRKIQGVLVDLITWEFVDEKRSYVVILLSELDQLRAYLG
jgi:hypothetical protein